MQTEIYDNFVEWDNNAADDFRRRLASRDVLGLVVKDATQEEWDEAVASFRKSNPQYNGL